MGGSAEALSALSNRKIRGATLPSRFVGLFVWVLLWWQAASTTCGTEAITPGMYSPCPPLYRQLIAMGQPSYSGVGPAVRQVCTICRPSGRGQFHVKPGQSSWSFKRQAMSATSQVLPAMRISHLSADHAYRIYPPASWDPTKDGLPAGGGGGDSSIEMPRCVCLGSENVPILKDALSKKRKYPYWRDPLRTSYSCYGVIAS